MILEKFKFSCIIDGAKLCPEVKHIEKNFIKSTHLNNNFFNQDNTLNTNVLHKHA